MVNSRYPNNGGRKMTQERYEAEVNGRETYDPRFEVGDTVILNRVVGVSDYYGNEATVLDIRSLTPDGRWDQGTEVQIRVHRNGIESYLRHYNFNCSWKGICGKCTSQCKVQDKVECPFLTRR